MGKGHRDCDFYHVPPAFGGDGGRPRVAINCCSCNASESFAVTHGGTTVSQDIAEKNFRNRGWTLGRDRKHDLCQSCKIERRARRTGAKPEDLMAKNVPPPQPVVLLAPVAKADPPREPTKDERRLIFGKLDQVYLDEKRGYEKGWSDARVAGGVGVPRAWVEAIRAMNFGEENASEDARQLVEQARAFLVEAKTALDKLTAGLETATAWSQQWNREAANVNAKRTELSELGRRVDALDALFRGKGR